MNDFPAHQAPLKDRAGKMSSMLRHALYASPLIISAAAIAATLVPELPAGGSTANAPRQAPAPAAAIRPEIAAAVASWDQLRQSDSLPFESYATFLLAHQGWPGEARLRRLAESKADPLYASPRLIVDYFTRFEPKSALGKARYAEALSRTGREAEARQAARAAWTTGSLPADIESSLLSRYGATFTTLDHDQRMERLLSAGSATSAQRIIGMVTPARRPLYETRIALQLRLPDATLRDTPVMSDPGYVMDKAKWLRDSGQLFAAQALLAQPLRFSAPPVDAEKWVELLLAMARSAAPETAVRIALNADQGFAPGTDISQTPFAIRDDYTSLVWLGGITALKKLNQPAQAAILFDRYARGAQTPQSRTKGWYWAARAIQAGGDRNRAETYLQNAARHGDQFYGQLAAERLGMPTGVIPEAPPVPIDGATRASFDASDLVQAARLLGVRGRWGDQSLFLKAIASSVETDADHQLAGELARALGRPDLAVMVARNWRNSGLGDPIRVGFPKLDLASTHQSQWTMIHAISRQESQFDRQIVSPAGARGLMQLMPGTARETAGKLGLPYDMGRLTSDPAYNVMLGSAFFAQMLDSFGGNHVLAVAAYNAGPGNVRKWIRANGDPRDPGVDVVDWIEAIPFTETRGYVQRVLENAVVYDRLNPAGTPARNRLSAYLGKNIPG